MEGYFADTGGSFIIAPESTLKRNLGNATKPAPSTTRKSTWMRGSSARFRNSACSGGGMVSSLPDQTRPDLNRDEDFLAM
ncbi:MAG: hypothetical protein H7222_05080 [Methylotenera sp.]|nr:hypothetical protein [Oligoflexia bacterium]